MTVVGAMTGAGASIALAILTTNVVIINCNLIKLIKIPITTITITTAINIIVRIATNIIVMMLS
jgi:hypothetical protein